MKALLKNLICAETTVEKGELAAAELIAAELALSGIEASIDCWGQNRANIFANIASGPNKESKAGLLFACHLDVVPAGAVEWNYPPFGAAEINGRIYGRGSADMKGGIAAVVTAIRQIFDSQTKLDGNILLAAVAGEETDGCGAKKVLADYASQLAGLAGVVIPEPTDFDVVTCHRGLLWLEIETYGKTAHGSAPQLGVNAISAMNSFLDELNNYEIPAETHKLLGNCSMSVNTISGGEAVNVIPDQCRIRMDIRTLPGQKHQDIIEGFEKIFTKLKRKNPKFEARINIVRAVDALQSDESSDFVRGLCSVVNTGEPKAVGFCTDGPYFASLGVPVIIFGPGKSELCHKPDEYIAIADMEKAVDYYKKIILKFLT